MWVILPNNAGWDCFQDSDFAGDLEDSKSTSGWTLCVFGSHTFVPTSWMCKKQTSFSHSSTESEITSLHAGLRLDGSSRSRVVGSDCFCFRGKTTQNHDRTGRPFVCPHTNHGRKQSRRVINDLDNVDIVPSNVSIFASRSFGVCVFEDNEAVIKMIIKGRSPTMRHVSRTHRVALDWLFDRINLDTKIQIKYIDTKNQLADMLTKGNFTRDDWNHLLCLFNISHFSSTDCSEVMSKRTQKESGWRKSHSKVETNDEFDRAKQWKGSISAIFHCIRKPGENQTRKSKSSEYASWKARQNGETRCLLRRSAPTSCIRTLIKLLRMESWWNLVSSRVEIWWIDGWWKGETRCLPSASVSNTFLSWMQERHFGGGKSR